MLIGFDRSSQQPGLALVLESEAVAINTDDDRAVQDTVEYRRGEYTVVRESASPAITSPIAFFGRVQLNWIPASSNPASSAI